MNTKAVLFGIIGIICLSAAAIAQDSGSYTLRGRTLDIETGEPVPLASVRLPDLEAGTLTRDDGAFQFTVPSGDIRIVISRTGYEPLERTITVNDSIGERLYFFLEPRVYRMEDVTIRKGGERSILERIQGETGILAGEDLDRNVSITLAETMKNQGGVAIRSMGPAPSRPVLRGLGGDRVVIGQNGLGTADLSATSPDHAVTVEPFTVDRIEIVRGPGMLLYSSVAAGGMIDTRKESVPQRLPPALTGTFGAYGETARPGGLGAATMTIPIGKWALYGETTWKRTGEEHTPSGTLGNTALENQTRVFGTSRIFAHGHAGISIDEFDSSYGIPGGFIGGHPHGVDIDMFRRSIRFSSSWEPGGARLESVTCDFDRTYYTHTEYESRGLVGAEFLQKNYTAQAMLTLNTFAGERNTRLAFDCRYRDLEMGGYVFTPPTRTLALAAAFYHEWDLGGMEIHLGGRYDHARYDPHPANDATIGRTAPDRVFDTVAAAVALVCPVGPHFTGGITLNRSARVPTIEELYNEGPHLAAYSYETGHPGLGTEYGMGIEVFGHWQTGRLTAVLTGYVNQMDSYIVFRNTGEINWQQILPFYRADAVDARIAGFESGISLSLTSSVTLDINTQYTFGSNLDDNLPLPMIPPFKALVDTRWERGSLTAGIETECAARQPRIDRFEKETAGYLIARPYVQKAWFHANIIHRLTLSVDNLFDAAFQNHLSRIKSIIPETGRNMRVSYRLYF